MQNDIEDIERLFRRAAESYPLNTSNGDWESVAKKLDRENPPAAAFFTKKDFINPVIFCVILTAAIGWLINLDWKYESIQNQQIISNTVSIQKNFAGTNNSGRKAEINPNRNSIINSSSSKAQLPVLPEISSLDKSIDKTDGKETPAYGVPTSKLNSLQSKSQPNNIKKEINSKFRSYNKAALSVQINSPSNGTIEQETTINRTGKEIKGNDLIIKTEEKNLPDNSLKETATILKADDSKLISDSLKENNTAIQKTNPHSVTTKHSTGLILGLLAGPDISNIKQQSFNKTGLSAGLTLAVIKNRFLIESGLMWDKKFYSSDGKYFNPKTNAGAPPANVYPKPIDISGVCNMFEIPVNIGYKILERGKKSLLVKAGISSYLMKYEHYNYSYYNSYYQRMNGSSSYNNSSNNYFSILNLSVEYNIKVAHGFEVGVQPYYKLPLQGVGYGQLQITSSGVFFVLTKKIL